MILSCLNQNMHTVLLFHDIESFLLLKPLKREPLFLTFVLVFLDLLFFFLQEDVNKTELVTHEIILTLLHVHVPA